MGHTYKLKDKKMKLTKQQVETILKNAPNGIEKESILDGLITRGYELEGVDTNLAKQKIESKKTTIEPQKGESTNSPSYLQRIGSQYSNIAERTTKALEKSGEGYMEKAQQGDILGATGELARSGLRAVGAVAEGAFAPIVEAPGIKQALDFIGEKIGNTEVAKNLAKKIQENPEKAQDIIDIVNTIALGGGKAIEAPLAKATEKAIPNILEKTITKTGDLIKDTGKSLYKVGVPMETPTKIAEQAYQASKPTLIERVSGLITGKKKIPLNKPITEAETAARQGLVGTEVQLGVQAKRASQNLWDNVVSPALDNSKVKVNMKSFIDDIKAEIISKTPDLSRRKELLNSLNKIKTDYKKVSNVSLKKLQGYKEGWAAKVPESSYKGKPITGALNEVRDMMAKKARTTIYDNAGEGIKTAYFDYGNLKSIADLGIKAQDQLRTKGITKQVWEFVLDTGLVPVTTVGGQVLYRTGQGLEFIGKKGAKKVGDLISKSSSAITTGAVQSLIPEVKE